jgi:hypothetical protein
MDVNLESVHKGTLKNRVVRKEVSGAMLGMELN